MPTSITTINSGDLISGSRNDINNNFDSILNNKIETSVLDTDTSLTANSDTKIATQKAVKAYADAVSSPTGRSWNDYAAANSGTDSYTITLTNFSAYVTGQTFKFKADVANTGAASLNVNGLGAKTIKKEVSNDLVTGDIALSQIVTVMYDGTNMQLVSRSNLLTPFYPQDVPIYLGTSTPRIMFATSNTSGSIHVFAYDLSGATATIVRVTRDSVTGLFTVTHSTTLTVDVSSLKGIAIAGNYVYVTAVISTVQSLLRYDLANLANVTTMTGLTDAGLIWSDGTNLYPFNSSNAWKKYSISGTVVTDLGATTFTSSGTAPTSCISDGNYAYISDSDGTGTYNIRKYALTGGAVISTTSFTPRINYWNAAADPILYIISASLLGFGFKFKVESNTAVISTMEKMLAIQLP